MIDKNKIIAYLKFLKNIQYSLLVFTNKFDLMSLIETVRLFDNPTIENVEIVLRNKNIKFEYIIGKEYLISSKYIGIESLSINMCE